MDGTGTKRGREVAVLVLTYHLRRGVLFNNRFAVGAYRRDVHLLFRFAVGAYRRNVHRLFQSKYSGWERLTVLV